MLSASGKAGGLEHRRPPGNLQHSRPQSWSSVLDAHQRKPSQKQHTVGWGAPGMRKGKRAMAYMCTSTSQSPESWTEG